MLQNYLHTVMQHIFGKSLVLIKASEKKRKKDNKWQKVFEIHFAGFSKPQDRLTPSLDIFQLEHKLEQCFSIFATYTLVWMVKIRV